MLRLQLLLLLLLLYYSKVCSLNVSGLLCCLFFLCSYPSSVIASTTLTYDTAENSVLCADWLRAWSIDKSVQRIDWCFTIFKCFPPTTWGLLPGRVGGESTWWMMESTRCTEGWWSRDPPFYKRLLSFRLALPQARAVATATRCREHAAWMQPIVEPPPSSPQYAFKDSLTLFFLQLRNLWPTIPIAALDPLFQRKSHEKEDMDEKQRIYIVPSLYPLLPLRQSARIGEPSDALYWIERGRKMLRSLIDAADSWSFQLISFFSAGIF